MAATATDDISKCIFLWKLLNLIEIALKSVPYGLIDNMAALVQIMAWCLFGTNPLSQAMLVCFNDAYMRHSASMS